jgi:hypothetical protein
MHECDEERTVIQHANRFPMIKTTMLKEDMIAMFFEANVNRSFTQMFQVKGIGHLLLDMIQEEGQLSLLIYRKKMILKIKKMIRQIRQSRKIMEGRQMKKTKKIII